MIIFESVSIKRECRIYTRIILFPCYIYVFERSRGKYLASILITFSTAHDLSVRDRAGEIGIPFTSGMCITLAEGRGFRRNRDQISRAFHRDDCRVLYWVLPRTAPYHGAATERQNIVESYLWPRVRLAQRSSHSSLLITGNLTW